MLYGKARRIWVMDRGIPTEAHAGADALTAARSTWSGRRRAAWSKLEKPTCCL